MNVCVAVPGRFHYHNYVKYLEEHGVLEQFYYSHKITSDFGISRQIAKNKWPKQYLLQGLHGRVIGNLFLEHMLPYYNWMWESAVLKDWDKPDVAHVLLHGAALRLIEYSKTVGTTVIGEAVNAHQDVVDLILDAEHVRLGLKYQRFDKIWGRMKQEYDHCQCILVSSEWVEKSFVEAGFHPEKICKLPYPSGIGDGATSAPKKTGISRNVRVICVAGIQVRKGQHYLLEAVKHLNKQNSRIKFELTLVGESGNMAYFSALRKMGVPFDHIAHLSNKEMVGFMGGFDVFVLPSLEDGFSVVVSEALQAGIPVVTTRNNGAADAIVDGKNGFVIPAQNSLALARAIVDAVDVKPEAGFVAPNQISDWQAYAERLISIYHITLSQMFEPVE